MREIHLDVAGEAHTITVEEESVKLPLTDVLRNARLPLNTRCGERSACDGCVVHLVAGSLISRPKSAAIHAGDEPIKVRSCEHYIDPAASELRLEIPQRALLAYEPQVVTDFHINVTAGRNPLCSDPQRPLGVAIDVGTTTVALLLVDSTTGTILARAASFNQQFYLGDDVVTRIDLCAADSSMVARLQHAVLDETIRPLIIEALTLANRNEAEIGTISIAANTIMLHLLAGDDPTPMGTAPFTPVFLEHRQFSAGALPLNIATHATIHLLPSAAAYVGADLTAGVFATGMIYDEGPSLLVDLGTNGEIILKHNNRLIGCATAAGPAFEGAKLECGMRAGSGAISHVRFKTDPFSIEIDMIPGPVGAKTKPIGLCGSAYVDILAEGRRSGLLSPSGRFETSALTDGAIRLMEQRPGNDLALRLAYGQAKTPVVISELDISRLLQAKAAIAAGILTLLNQTGVDPSEVKTLYLAGGFGQHVTSASAIACGLLPGFTCQQVQVVGDTSLAGAYLSLLDATTIDIMSNLARTMNIIELNLDPGFEDRYIDQLPMP
ncbi:MAG: DUF4445 domain-containing protein [Phycisphaerales bacterium]|nr:DUF4445 domain-containing protein [Phycisphaerales bacterium]